MENLLNGLPETILGWINKTLKGVVEVFIEFIQNIVLNYDGLTGLATNAFHTLTILSAIALITICLFRVLKMLIGEADGSQEANAWSIIIDTVKSGIFLVIGPLIVSVTFEVTKIITDSFTVELGSTMMDSVDDITSSSNIFSGTALSIWTVILWLFVAIVLGFFVFKVAIEQVQLMFNEILVPIIAMSIVSEDYDMLNTWVKDLISHSLTIITLILSIALFSEAILGFTVEENFWPQITMVIGTGALVLAGPSLIKSIRFSSGVNRTAQSAGRMAMRFIPRK